MNRHPAVFKDKNGDVIEPGCVIKWDFIGRRRQFPGRRKAVINPWTEEWSAALDEGDFTDVMESHWIKYLVEWCGACLVANRVDYTPYDGCELFDLKGKRTSDGPALIFMTEGFKSDGYEIVGRVVDE